MTTEVRYRDRWYEISFLGREGRCPQLWQLHENVGFGDVNHCYFYQTALLRKKNIYLFIFKPNYWGPRANFWAVINRSPHLQEILGTFTCTAIAASYTISISFFTALSLAGNDLIILQMNHSINLFHKHYLQVLIKTIKAKQSVQIKKFACLN